VSGPDDEIFVPLKREHENPARRLVASLASVGQSLDGGFERFGIWDQSGDGFDGNVHGFSLSIGQFRGPFKLYDSRRR
jgi:hypothetical protein